MNWTVQLLHRVPVIQSVNILSKGKRVHKTFRLLWVAISAFSDMKVSFKSSLCVHLREGNQPANSPIVLSEALQKLLKMWRGPECTTAAHDTQPARLLLQGLLNPGKHEPNQFELQVFTAPSLSVPSLCNAGWSTHIDVVSQLKRTMQNAAKNPHMQGWPEMGSASSLQPSQSCVCNNPGCGWGTLPVLWGRASLEWLSVVFGSLFLETWGGEANNIPSELRENLQWKLSHCLISIVLSSAEIHERSLSKVPEMEW